MLIRIEYDGTGLVGWQRQNNGPSVQAFLEQAAKKLTTRPTQVLGSGRTDAGVHATGQAAHLDVPTHLTAIDVMRGLNALLETNQVSVVLAQPVAASFNARFDAVQRSYLYRILTSPCPFSPAPNAVWHHRAKLDVTAMHEAAQTLIGRFDFSSFGQPGARLIRLSRQWMICLFCRLMMKFILPPRRDLSCITKSEISPAVWFRSAWANWMSLRLHGFVMQRIGQKLAPQPLHRACI